MKQFLFILFLCTTMLVQAQVSKTVNVTTPGTLSSLLTITEQSTVTNITITGTIDSLDFITLKACLQLSVIDLSGANIVGNHIPETAFQAYSSLSSISLPSLVTTIGNYAFNFCSGLTSIALPQSLISIGEGAFNHCTSLKSIDLPPSLDSIGFIAFSNSGLTSVDLPSSVTSIGIGVFSNCVGLTSVTIPSSVTSLGNYAFSGCIGLTSFSIPSSVSSIGESTFSGCSGLDSISISSSVTSIGSNAFAECKNLKTVFLNSNKLSQISEIFNKSYIENVIIGNDITSIPPYYFYNCNSLKSVTIPSSVTSIGEYAFAITGLNSVDFPSSVTSIGSNAFGNCSELQSITFPSSITTIGDNAFMNCDSLKTVYYNANQSNPFADIFSSSPIEKLIIGNNITSIPDDFFSHCVNLKSVILPSSLSSIGKNAFSYCIGLTSISLPQSITLIDFGAFSFCKNLKTVFYDVNQSQKFSSIFYNSKIENVIIGNNVTSIPDYFFQGYGSLKSVTIPQSVKSIGYYAFSDCAGLDSISIPQSITSISDGTFSGCTSLSYISLPSSVTSIGEGAFSRCFSLSSVAISSSVTSIGEYAFSGIGSVNIEENNPMYRSLDGVVFNKSLTKLIHYPSDKTGTFTIPSTVSEIISNAFFNCKGLNTVFIPYTVSTLGYDIFGGDTLQKVISFAVLDHYTFYSAFVDTLYVSNVNSNFTTNTHIKKVIYFNPCISTENSVIMQGQTVPPVLSITDTTICAGNKVNIIAPSQTAILKNNYHVSNIDISNQGANTIILQDSISGCTDTVMVNIKYSQSVPGHLTKPIFKYPSDTIICSGTSFVLKAPLHSAFTNQSNSSSVTLFNAGIKKMYIKDSISGCTDTTVINVKIPTAYNEQIKLVTNNNTGDAIIVAWTQTPNVWTEGYAVQKLSDITGTYQTIAKRSVGDSTFIIDKLANTGQQAYSYRLITYDTLCHDSAISYQHQTIHLASSLSSNSANEVQLSWNAYQGLSPAIYKVYALNNGTAVDSFSLAATGSLSYTYAKHQPGYKYRVGFDLDNPFTPSTLKADIGSFKQSLSNVVEAKLTGIALQNNNAISVYPNPVINNAVIECNSNTIPVVFDIISQQGQRIYSGTLTEKAIIPMQKFPAGVYTLLINNGTRTTSQQIIKQ